MKDEIPVWTVREKVIKGATQDRNRIEAHLIGGGRVVHVVNGPTALKSLQDYADKLNASKAPVPPIPPKTRADGWSQPKDINKVSHVIAPEIFNHVVQ